MSHFSATLAVALTATFLSAQTVTNQFNVAGASFVGGVMYDPIDGTIWSIDETLKLVTQFDRAGAAVLNSWSPAASGATLPIGGFVHPATGNIWIGDEGEMVYEFDRTGVLVSGPWSTAPAITDLSAMTYDPASDTIWISNDSSQVLHEFDLLGAAIGGPISVAASGSTDPDGCVYNPFTRTFYLGEDMTDQIIEVDRTGALVASWSTVGLGISPEGLALDSRTGALFIGNGFIAPIGIFEVAGIAPVPASTGLAAYGTGCADSGGTVPFIGASDPPKIGSGTIIAMQTSITSAAVSVINAGFAKQNIPLAFLGAPGCFVLTLPSIAAFGVPRSASNRAGFVLDLRGLPAAAIGFTFNVQGLNAPDTGVPGSISSSQGLTITLL